MNMHLSRILKQSLIVFSGLLLFHACTDEAWEEHYQNGSGITSDLTLLEQLQQHEDLNDFRTVLDSVRVMNGHKVTDVRYADLLNQQFFTVFAPVDGTFDVDSLLSLCTTTSGNELVAEQFVMSHLSRLPYSLSPVVDEKARMLNGKYLPFADSSLAGTRMITERSNIQAKNGVVHCVNGPVPYLRNLYESLTQLDEFSGMGGFLTKYQKDSLNEEASIVKGINDLGMMEYVDSVLIEKNMLLRSFGLINSEDSSYCLVAPSKTAWDAMYTKVNKYFRYPANTTNSDSLSRFWTNYSLMRDLIFNWNEQESPTDSLISTGYSYLLPEQHVFYKPFETGGILDGAETLTASNGTLYKVNTWPFDMEDVFFTPILVEAEKEKFHSSISTEKFKIFTPQFFADSVSGSGYLEINPISPATQTDATFYIPNTLSGKYEFCVVFLPRTLVDLEDTKKNKFNAFVTCSDPAGTGSITTQCKSPEGSSLFTYDGVGVDTISLGYITLPTCNYRLDKMTVTVRIKSTVSQKEINLKTFTNKMFIDCFYLKPRQD